MSADKVEALLAKTVKIPPQPRVLVEVNDLILSGRFDIRSLARTLGQDAGLTSMLFKLVRSPLYAKGRSLDNLEQVLMVVGVKQTLNLVRAAALTSTIGGDSGLFESFWQRSTAIARLAAIIAGDRVQVCNIAPDQAYLAGVFHDCGVPLLVQRFEEYGDALRATGWPPQWAAVCEEDLRLGVDHAVIGYLVARHWGLPDFVCNAIRWHHELRHLSVDHDVHSMVAILQMAIELYCRESHFPNPEWPLMEGHVLSELGIHVDDFPVYSDEMRDRFRSSDV
ncbi:MAG: HDOD domain-containing protein [Zoogloea sp.]|nr:HDOD domain-containing protein [Zoogloea sp.]